MTERIENLIKEGFDLKEKATIILGFAYHEKAIFCVKGGALKSFPTEGLDKQQVQALRNCWTVEAMEELAEEFGIAMHQSLVEDGIYYDDIFVFDITNHIVKLYEYEPSKTKN